MKSVSATPTASYCCWNFSGLEKVNFGSAYKQNSKCICLHINVLVQQLSKSYAVSAVQMVCYTAAQDTRYLCRNPIYITCFPMRMKSTEKNFFSVLLLLGHFLEGGSSL